MKITNSDLYKQQFSETVLIDNINNLNEKHILHTQKLTPEFCMTYIYCMDDIDYGSEDSYLFDISYILKKQPHINKNDLLNLLKKK
jgi:hypothetical protein